MSKRGRQTDGALARPGGRVRSGRPGTPSRPEPRSLNAHEGANIDLSCRKPVQARQSWPNVDRIASVIALAGEASAASAGREGDPAIEALAYALAGAIDVLADAVGAAAA
jgi:hypothetical protein